MNAMDMKTMAATAPKVSGLMKVLSNENRLLILCQLSHSELSVGDLARALDMRQAALSQQLALLRKDGLVTTRRDGQTIYYSLARDDVRALMSFLYELYCKAS